MTNKDNDYQDFISNLRNNALINQTSTSEEFLSDTLKLLEEIQELNNPVQHDFIKKGRHNRTMEINAYDFDEADKSLSLIINDFEDTDNPTPINNARVKNLTSKMLLFLEEVYNGQIHRYCDDSDEMIKISHDMRRKMLNKIETEGLDDSIEKIKFYILTNSNASERFKTRDNIIEYNGFKIKTIIFPFDRIKQVIESGLEKENIILDLVNDYDMPYGIPCVLANISENANYQAYLGIIPGKILSQIYYENDSKILEGNVRAFLSTRGNVNKGIRRTILTEPQNFFTYNNGISTTAKSIETISTEKGLFITKIEDFQIINGGQTTASLTSANLKDNNELDDIFVPMKLTVVHDENYEEMVKNIAKYANTQNKVTAADMFSNHPFHVKMENLSERVMAPPKNMINSTFWYYERSRGKYEQKQFRLKTKSERNRFLNKYPKNQVIKKEELAKYMNSLFGKPHIVSRGSMRNMNDFANYIDRIWESKTKGQEAINEDFFKRAVVSAIIFKTTDSHIYKSDWYEKGGYKANIVTYTIAKIIDSIPTGYTINYDSIWRNQSLSQAFIDEIYRIGLITQQFILDAGGTIVTEYCKKEDTWKKYKELKVNLSRSFINELVSEERVLEQQKDAIKDEKQNTQISNEALVVQLGDSYWESFLKEASRFESFTYRDKQLIHLASTIHKTGRVPTSSQLKEIMKIRSKMEELGVIIK